MKKKQSKKKIINRKKKNLSDKTAFANLEKKTSIETIPKQSSSGIPKYVADRTSKQKLISVAGGGDTVSALKISTSESKFSYVSTAGGAFLEWLEGKSLPGIESLKI